MEKPARKISGRLFHYGKHIFRYVKQICLLDLPWRELYNKLSFNTIIEVVMKKFFGWILKAAIAGAAALLLLCLWCFFYYNVPVHFTNETGATEYRWESGKFYRKGTEGFAFGRTNNEGFNNLLDYEPGDKIDLLLMGSSHMEAMNVAPEDNAAAVLNRLFDGEKYTYNIGTSGHTLMYCLKHLDSALDTYAPQSCAVIETRTLSFSEAELAAVAEGTLPDIPSRSGGLVGMLQKLPYLRLMYTKYVKDSGGDDGETPAGPTAPTPEENARKSELLDEILDRAAESCRRRGVELVLVYDPTVYVDESGAAYTLTDGAELEMFKESCRETGIAFIDLTESYLDLFNAQHKLPYGFLNTSPGRGHMNRWGHELFAEAVYNMILEG